MTDEIGPKRVLVVLLLALLAGISSQFLSIGVELRIYLGSLFLTLIVHLHPHHIFLLKNTTRVEIIKKISHGPSLMSMNHGEIIFTFQYPETHSIL